MLTHPKTKADAEKCRYGTWAGRPKGAAYNPNRCACEVFPAERGAMHHQCERKNGHGPDGLYCKQHAKFIK